MASSTPINNPNPTAIPPPPSSHHPRTLTYYHAGPLFTLADLAANISLSHLISTLTQPPSSSSSLHLPPHLIPILPQTLEPRSLHPHAIRDADLRALISCDLALFIYDGAEIDSGTVVEYMVAKMADIPSVILRTDFRGGGDQHQLPLPTGDGVDQEEAGKEGGGGGGGVDSFNLMSSFWPRTKAVRVDSMSIYKTGLNQALSSSTTATTTATNTSSSTTSSGDKDRQISLEEANAHASRFLLEHTAKEVVKAITEVLAMPPRMPVHLREGVYEWLGAMVGWRDGVGTQEMRRVLEGKVERGVI